MEAKKKWDLGAISSVPLIMTLGNSMLIPILPAMRKVLSVSSFQISLLITVYSVVAIILIPIAGYFSDRFGRKKIMIPCLLIAGLGGLVSGLGAWILGSDAYGLILAGRFLQGIGAAGAAPIVLPLVGDMFNKESDVSSGLGLIETSNTFGKVLSPILGSLLAMWVWYGVFLAIPVFSLISVLLIAFLVKVPNDNENGKATGIRELVKGIGAIARQKGKWLSAVFAIGGIGMFELFGLQFYLSTVLEEQFGLDGILKGCLLAIPLTALCLASYLTGKGIGERKKLMKWLTVSGMVLLSGSLAGLAWIGIKTLWIFFVLVSFGGIGIGISLPCLDALITEGIEKEHRGTVSSIYSSMRFIGVAAGPPLVSLGMRWPASVLFSSLAGAGMLAAVTGLLAVKPGKRQSH